VNIWLVFVPGAAATTIEKIIREVSTHKCLPVLYRQGLREGEEDIAINAFNSHKFCKQWHPCTSAQLKNPIYKSAEVNIFTPIVPMKDWNGKQVLEYIKSISTHEDYLFYLGPHKDNIDFMRIAQQKVPDRQRHTTKYKTIWEQREHMSYTYMGWYAEEMIEQMQIAKQLGYIIYDAKDIFVHLKEIIIDILYYTAGRVADKNKFEKLCSEWIDGQDEVWQQFYSFKMYKDTIQGKANHNVNLNGNILLEAMIQHYIRQQDIELLCYDLNKFPSSKEITNYYAS
tara:strand:- start:1156 stop:2007 length:852 start_codon:yes stop_codon:yes gene_type:complete